MSVKNQNKKQQKKENNKRRNEWSVSPVTKIVIRKDKYNRNDKSWQKEF